jgi:hypothetical protein
MNRSIGILPHRSRSSEAGPAPARRQMPGRSRAVAAIALVAIFAGACSSSTAIATTAVTLTPTVAPTVAPTATGTPAGVGSAVPTDLATGVPTSLDPCQLVTSQEASQLSGASFVAGVESTTAGNGKMCTYGGQTTNVFEVIVGQEPDVASAQAGKAAAEADIQKAAGNGIQFIELPTLADGAAYFVGSVSVSGVKINASAIYVLKGTVFFGFSDEALGPTPTSSALQAQVQTILGRLP